MKGEEVFLKCSTHKVWFFKGLKVFRENKVPFTGHVSCFFCKRRAYLEYIVVHTLFVCLLCTCKQTQYSYISKTITSVFLFSTLIISLFFRTYKKA